MLLPIARWKAVTLCQYFAGLLQREREREREREMSVAQLEVLVQSNREFRAVGTSLLSHKTILYDSAFMFAEKTTDRFKEVALATCIKEVIEQWWLGGWWMKL